jgi:hypothetical protein
MNSSYILDQQAIVKVNYFQPEVETEQISETDSVKTIPLSLPEENTQKWTTDFDMSEEGLW